MKRFSSLFISLVLLVVSLGSAQVYAAADGEVGGKPIGGSGIITEYYLNQASTADPISPPIVNKGEGNHVYIDIRMRRTNTTQGNSLYIQGNDGSDRRFVVLNFNANKYPQLDAYNAAGTAATKIGDELLSDGSSALSFPTEINEWAYIRVIITQFATGSTGRGTFEIYQGATLDSLEPLVKDGTTTFTSSHAGVINLTRIRLLNSNALAVNYLKVYEVNPNAETPVTKPVASDVTMEGKPNIGTVLTADYGTFSDESGKTEGDSYGYWEAASTKDFDDAIKLSEDIPVAAEGTYYYTLTETAKGKYVRFCVVPVNDEGTEGEPVYSNTTAAAVGVISYTLSTTGNIKNANQFDLKDAVNEYAAKVEIVNTSSTSVPLGSLLIAAWYKEGSLFEVHTTPISALAGTTDEYGIVNEEFTTAAKNLPSGMDISKLTLKIYLWDGFGNVKPLTAPALYGVIF